MTEQDISQFLALARSPAELEALQRRISSIRAQAGQPTRRYGTWAGAALGGLGDMVRAFKANDEISSLEGEYATKASAADAVRGRALKRALAAEENARAGSAAPPMYGPVPPPGMGGSPPAMFAFADEGTDQEHAQAMSSALRDRNLSTLMAASGDPVLGSVGRLQLDEQRAMADALRRREELGAASALAQSNYLRDRRDKLEDATTQRSFQEREHTLDRVSRERAAALSAGLQMAKEQRAASVPGMDVAEGAAPTADDAKKVKASLASAQRIKAHATELRKLHKTHGTEYGGEVGNKQQSLAEQIRLEAKNVAELGALSGPDMAIIERLAQADPGSFAANVKALFGVDNTQGALDDIEKWAQRTLEGTSSAYGYRKKTNDASVDDVLKAFEK